MKRALAVGALAAAALGTTAGAVSAHEGHGSCGEGARAYVVALAHSGNGGVVASAQARAGTINEDVAAAHAAFCDPAP